MVKISTIDQFFLIKWYQNSVVLYEKWSMFSNIELLHEFGQTLNVSFQPRSLHRYKFQYTSSVWLIKISVLKIVKLIEELFPYKILKQITWRLKILDRKNIW